MTAARTQRAAIISTGHATGRHVAAMSDELIHQCRGVAVFGEVVSIDDTGEAQTITVLSGRWKCTLTVAGLLRFVAQTVSIEAQAGSTIHGPVTFTEAVIFQAGVTFQADVTIQGALHVAGAVTGASFNGHS